MSKPLFLCVHGHFYQPPRENPWIDEIERQEGASPFHDWNERIYYECYLPNSAARILDSHGYIVNIVSNYEMMNYNFGPTLLTWLERRFPETYRDILSADKQSAASRGGHGNAIAQAYHHLIMPLANRRDKVTQVKWGIRDFQHRFGRDPEAMWLPETACNEETLEVLVEAGMKFLILAPLQAEAVRPLAGGTWQDVSNEQIDPKQPYRCFLRNGRKHFIDIFFYDGPVSKAAGFDNIVFDAKLFGDRIDLAVDHHRKEPQLIHLATDGETFGHHKAFGERALAYLLNVEAPKRGYQVVNYAQYLELHPPKFEVRIKEGENGEGTSWSCAHGVGRWKDHCGCRGGGPAEWTQHWRKPLRQALDWLRDELAKLYEREGHPFFKDVWDARDDYIDVLLTHSDKMTYDFFNRHATRVLSKQEVVRAFKLLEIERHAMLMYTSCGWFFTELSGIETVQILQYAARAIELARDVTGHLLEEPFLERLQAAKSNLAEFKDGRGVYDKLVRPRMVSLRHAVSAYAISSMLEDSANREPVSLHGFKITVLHQRTETFGNLILTLGHLRAASLLTGEEEDLMFAAVQFGVYDFRSSVKPFTEQVELETIERELFDGVHASHVVELMRKIDGFFGSEYQSLRDLPLEARSRIISILSRDAIDKINDAYDNLYEENRRMNEIYRSVHLPIPQEIRYAVRHTLGRRLKAAMAQLCADRFVVKKATLVYRLIELAHSLDVEFNREEIAAFLSEELAKRTKELVHELDEKLAAECLGILKIAKKINVALSERAAQDYLFHLLRAWRDHPEKMHALPGDLVGQVLKLAQAIHIKPKELIKSAHAA